MADENHFIMTEDLARRLGDPALSIIDGSWHLPASGRDGRREFETAHIPGAVFFDIDAIADRSTPLPHMMPSNAAFEAAVSALGIASDDDIVVYDGAGLFSAARVWWMFRTFGARSVKILAGGFPKWLAEGRPTTSDIQQPKQARFLAKLDPQAVAQLEAVAEALRSSSAQVVDARPAARFAGEAQEPRPGIRAGHMPGSLNLPFGRLIKDGHLADRAEISEIFAQAGVDLNRPVITSCGSGVSAAILTLALSTIGKTDVALYDGSWAEWGSRADTPVATGPA